MVVKKLLLTGAFLLTSTAFAQATPTGGNAYFFGDSLTDCCVYGRTTAGPNWADLLAPQIGETYTATAQSNYATGGSISSSYLSQITSFTGSGIAVGPNDIAAIWIGTNDVWTSSYAATDTFQGGPPGGVEGPLPYQPTAAALTTYIIGKIQTGINQLEAAGIRNILLLSTYDLAQSAVEPNATDAALATQYSTALRDAESTLYTPGVNTYFVDVESLMQQVQANAPQYGFTHLTGADNCNANNCLSQSSTAQSTYIFQDIIHVTSAFDQLVANDAAAVINSNDVTLPAQIPVPEPSSAALTLAGLAALGFARGSLRGRPTL